MYCISRVAVLTQSRPISSTLRCFKQISNLVKVPVLLLNPNSSMKVKSLNKSSSVKFYKPNILVKLIDTDGNVFGETTYSEAKELALKKNMKLFDMESDPQGKMVQFKFVTGEEYYKLSRIAKEEKKARKEAANTLEMKVIRLKSNIMDHDVDIKMRNAMVNLKKGHPIQFTLYRAKNVAPEVRKRKGEILLDKIEEYIGEEGKLKLSDKSNILCYIYPNDYNFK